MTARLAWLAWCMAVECVLWGSLAAAQPPRGQPKVMTWEAPDPSRRDCYGILGDVARPGVYSTSAREVTLQDLVQHSGGITAQASPTVRVVRQGRPAHSLLFSPTGRDVLQPRDVVVVDSASHHTSANATWLCLVGVIDRPVVVPVRPELAQLTTIVRSMLDQSEELAKAVRVVPPPRTTPLTRQDAFLPSGTVLVFDQGLLVTKNLPAFPETIAMEAPLPAQPDDRDHGLSSGESRQTTAAGNANWSTSLASQSRDRVDATPVPFPTLDNDATSAQPTSLPAPGSRFYVPPPPIASPPTDDEPPLDPRIAADESVEVFPSAAALKGDSPTTTTQQPPVSWWHMLGISGTVACLIGIAIATRKYLEHTGPVPPPVLPEFSRAPSPLAEPMESPRNEPMPSPPSVVAPATEPDDLADLLQGRLPIVTESVQFPRQFRLQRQREPSSASYRVDVGRNQTPLPHHQPVSAPAHQAVAIDGPVSGVPRPHYQSMSAHPLSAPLSRVCGGEGEGEEAAGIHRPLIRPSATFPPADGGAGTVPVLASGSALERALSQLQRGPRP
uniref:Soluble ligand binding domain-containing protein n=1 Tax=Schlesneria paludicola TaxID=360056 RepID=A0A7C2P7G9_9PLAN